LGAVLAMIRDEQLCREPQHRTQKKRRAGAISATLVSLKSVEPFSEPKALAPAQRDNGCGCELPDSGAGRALRYARASRPPAA
jgi:hypothetical protein